MKRIIIVFLVLVLVVPLVAQAGDESNDGNTRNFSAKIELGYRFGSRAVIQWGCDIEEESFNYWKMHVIPSYQINRYLSIGLGTGLHRAFPHGIFVEWFNSVYLPLFLDIRISYSNRTLSPYINTGIGYTFWTGVIPAGASDSWQTDAVGFYLNPSVGVSYKISTKFRIYADIGYDLQRKPVSYYLCEGFTDNSHALNLNIGLLF